MKNSLITTLFLFIATHAVLAQRARFTSNGSIEFEKRINMFALLDKTYGKSNDAITQQVYKQLKTTQPQFKTLRSVLNFNNGKTLFTPITDQNAPLNGFLNMPMVQQNKIIYTDFFTQTTISQKTFFEETFLVKDSINKIKWKLTGETRDIAGFTCHRANGLILDSIYVVAFYADQIVVSGGPESFQGLPGMILEVALPHENIIWIANKVTVEAISNISPPVKGKPINNKGLREVLKPAVNSSGVNAEGYNKAIDL